MAVEAVKAGRMRGPKTKLWVVIPGCGVPASELTGDVTWSPEHGRLVQLMAEACAPSGRTTSGTGCVEEVPQLCIVVYQKGLKPRAVLRGASP
eukprot:7236294-Prymnesium_polylepis.2